MTLPSPVQNSPEKKFNFIDSIRCIAMMGIVLEHSTYVGTFIFSGLTVNNIFYMSLMQLPKFGTVSFFILAGFLIGSKFKDYSPGVYFKRRLASTFLPWLFWSALFVFTMTYKFYIIEHKNVDFNLTNRFFDAFRLVYLYSNYWFIINFLICIGILLIFRKHLYSLLLGGILAVFTLIYSTNIYLLWFPPIHTMAIFGFVFFLWLGAQCNRYWDQIQAFIHKTPYWLLVFLLLLTYALAVGEIAYLYHSENIEPYNTLRFSNILYSLVCITLLLKIRDFKFTNYFRPRETTFGIYLIHYIIVFNVLPEILRPLGANFNDDLSIVGIFGKSILRFLIVYSITLLMVFGLMKTKLKVLIGR